MAASLQSLTCSSPVARCSSHLSPSNPGIYVFSCASPQRVRCSSFHGLQLRLPPLRWASQRSFAAPVGQIVMMVQPRIQFIQGNDELTIPEVKLTKSKDGTNGAATFIFTQPSVFDSSKEVGDITGLYMIDEEGVLSSNIVNAKFLNGKPESIEARYIMRTPKEWDRFMRFMERYANANGLQFVKK